MNNGTGKNSSGAAVFGLAIVTAAVLLFVNKAGATLPNQAEFLGKITDAANGSPLSGVTVTVGNYLMTTGSDGIFDITDIPPGDYPVSFAKAGYVTINL